MVVAVAVTLVLALAPVGAARAQSLIRDAEIETIIRAYAAPLLRGAGIAPESVTIRLLNDSRLNAFVATGNRMYLFTGLILRTEKPEELIGVIAHEIGHIAGGHHVRLGDSLENLSTTSLVATLLGTAAGALVGRPDLGLALGSVAQGAAIRNFMAYSRTQESSADAFALKALDRENLPATGLLAFMHELETQDALTPEMQDPYLRTHPLTRDRILSVENHVNATAQSSRRIPPGWADLHARMLAKLNAFLRPPGEALRMYQGRDDIPGRYAQAIAHYRAVELEPALALIDGLIADEPNNPYFQELKGQMLFENSRVTESLAAYERAVALLPDAPLLRVSLAHAQIESGDPTLLEPAQDNLRNALTRDADNGLAWRLLAQAYGQAGDTAMADYAMAETALRTGDYPRALFHVGRAETQLKRGSPTWLRLQDIRVEAERRRDAAD
ncbi:M48 family metallopeptidase [Roseospira marina]|uniref:M48 family metallopeptidase n=2 Tax=Roseospira marina TaxID=140057 RepID=A0A5M6IA80_9PROT|nr:M48 family metalloprotease [Roseospira marina]KAA5604635.1 M48 family metallopeptidase [Roseospira marina]MBB4315077.1 putative Zn-dependent protease [Roseospira marina]